MSSTEGPKKWDVFISHASEDKEVFVRPLAEMLHSLGMSVWYDEFALKPGDSLSRSIDKGILGSRYGLVVISPAFIKKNWPEYELRGLITREMGGSSLIIPIWYEVEQQAVEGFSPTLADKIALRTSGISGQDIALKILMQVRPDLYERHPRGELIKLASRGTAPELKKQVDALNAENERLRTARFFAQEAARSYQRKESGLYAEFVSYHLEAGCDLDTAYRKADEEYREGHRFAGKVAIIVWISLFCFAALIIFLCEYTSFCE